MDLISYIIGKNAGGASGGSDWSAIGYSEEPQVIQDDYNYAKAIYDNWDDNVTSLYDRFRNDEKLVYMPLVNTSNVQSCYRAFYNCRNLAYVPELNTSNVTNFENMFALCFSLVEIPQLDTSNGTNFGSFCSLTVANSKLKKVPKLNLGKATNISSIINVAKTNFTNQLTELGGLLDLGKAYLTTQSANYSNYTLSLSNATKLTHDSLMNIINNLYDIKTKGCNTQSLVLGEVNLQKLTEEEIAIATNKGWTVS